MGKQKEEESEKEKIEKTKSISIVEGSAYAVSDGSGVRYITPYALSLGATNAHVGLLSSLPSLVGSLSQLFTPKVMEKIPRKKIVFYGVLLQAIMWLVVIAVGTLAFILNINSGISPLLLIVVYTLLILCGAFCGPAWNSWMKDIVRKKTGKYFGMRNRIVGTVALVSMFIAGFVLDYYKKTNIFFGFVILFGVAFLARSISAFLFLKKYEPSLRLKKEYYFSFLQFLKRMPQNNFGKFVIFVALIQLATAIASPFFAVYMLKELHFSYTKWMIVTLSSSLFSLIFMPIWGKFADDYGNIKVVKMCGMLIPVIPLLWIASPFLSLGFLVCYLIMIEAFSGFVWAGFNLSAGNFIYDAVTRQRMALCVAYFNILQGIGVFIGASFGGLVSSLNFSLLGSSLIFIFLISSILRMTTTLIMIPKIKEVREVKKFGIEEAKERLTSLTPGRLWKSLEISLRPRQIST